MSSDQVVVLRRDDPLGFVADACAALADLANEVHDSQWRDSQVVVVYAGLVRAYANLLRTSWSADDVRTRIVEHLLMRLDQALVGEIVTPVEDIVDRLHAEITRESALS